MFNYVRVVYVNCVCFCISLCMFYGYLCTGKNVYALLAVCEHTYLGEWVSRTWFDLCVLVCMCAHSCMQKI